ncbi:TetR/AcrR family transcriptional regulator [Microbacterium sp. Leaf320]|uniref:TetR/AcrR family transcriptional regulator n=1 Tax=Microbacterium sp. Leaf320 TaxID=1736334 RepID=UPI001F474503|nr:TetR/AcrR family transcriptional regulator [Microbacterium sp. Leaf320]
MEKAQAIEQAATDLVLAHGYDAVTVDMICARAGVSQRTFFNHFPTKDIALLGDVSPWLDEEAAERFTHSTGPLLDEAARLIRLDPRFARSDPSDIARRIRAVASSPTLRARQISRVDALHPRLEELILARLTHQYPNETDHARRDQAALITQMVFAVMRFTAQLWADAAATGQMPALDPERISDLVAQALTKLRP